MKPVYVVYITFYRGNRLPPFYVGKTYEDRILKKRYNGSPQSKEYKTIWRRDPPELFKTMIPKGLLPKKTPYFESNLFTSSSTFQTIRCSSI
jgi:hypothetical protein